MHKVVMQLHESRFFATVGPLKSCSRAAEQFGLAKGRVSTAGQHLEERAGTRLLQRTIRCVRLFLDGERFLDRGTERLSVADQRPAAWRGRARTTQFVDHRRAPRAMLAQSDGWQCDGRLRYDMNVHNGMTRVPDAFDCLVSGMHCGGRLSNSIMLSELTMNNSNLRKIGDIAVATISNPPDNTLSLATRRDLLAAIEQAFADRDVRALILIGDGANYVAGTDIQDFGKPYTFPSLNAVLDAVMAAPKPVIAALHGAAFGGGLELALACQWRIATPAAQVAQPEVKLGLMPSGGATQWWTRLAGPTIALDVCTSGAPMAARAAHDCGVIDRLTESDDDDELLQGAIAFAHDILDGRVAPRQLMLATDKLAAKPDLFIQFRRVHAAAWQGLLAPWKIVDCIEAACQLSFVDGYRFERAAFRECQQSAQSRAQVHLFLAAQAAVKRPAADAPAPAGPLADVGVIGDTARAHALIESLRAAGIGVSDVAADSEATTPRWPARCDLVIDATGAAADELAARAKALLSDAPDEAVVVVDAPDIDLNAVGAASGRPAAVLGIDTATPRLLGIRVATAGSAPGLARVLSLARQLQRMALTSPAHTITPAAALRQTLIDAHTELVSQGVSLVQQQRVLASFGFEQERLDAIATSASLYDEVLPVLASPLSDHAVQQQLLYALVNGGARLLANGSVWRPADVDLAAVHSLGFPAHVGGPMWWSQTQGFATVAAMIARYRGKAGAHWLAPAVLNSVMHGASWRVAS